MKNPVVDIKGNVAIAFALCVIPVIGAMGLALDTASLSSTRTSIQAQADADALSARNGIWLTETEYHVTKHAVVEPHLMALLGAGAEGLNVSATALHVREKLYKPPVLTSLDNSAALHNKLSLYCYDSETDERSQMVEVADNRGTEYTYAMPQCGSGSSLEMMLQNDNNGIKRTYTDSGAKGQSSAVGMNMVERIICDSLKQCQSVKTGGIIPEGEGRIPIVDKRPCEAGKYVYYGWEDLPDFDKDYDDLRILMECPEESEKRLVRLID